MELKTQIIKVMELYDKGKYSTSIFCEVFLDLYYFENSGYRCFHGEERRLLDELGNVIDRYSEYEMDRNDGSGFYTSREQVETKFREVMGELKLIWNQ